jgi:hypothetical protein
LDNKIGTPWMIGITNKMAAYSFGIQFLKLWIKYFCFSRVAPYIQIIYARLSTSP